MQAYLPFGNVLLIKELELFYCTINGKYSQLMYGTCLEYEGTGGVCNNLHGKDTGVTAYQNSIRYVKVPVGSNHQKCQLEIRLKLLFSTKYREHIWS